MKGTNCTDCSDEMFEAAVQCCGNTCAYVPVQLARTGALMTPFHATLWRAEPFL